MTTTGVDILAPSGVPDGITLTLQLKTDSDPTYYTYQEGVVSDDVVSVTGLSACSWYVARWLAVPDV